MKKKVLLSVIIVMMLLYAPTVLAKPIIGCDSVLPGVMIDEKITSATSTIITIIKIVVPILLVIFGSLDLVKGVIASKDDEIKKGQQIFIKRLIAGALVFFVISIVQLVINFVAGSDNENMWSCVNCFLNDCETMPDEEDIKSLIFKKTKLLRNSIGYMPDIDKDQAQSYNTDIESIVKNNNLSYDELNEIDLKYDEMISLTQSEDDSTPIDPENFGKFYNLLEKLYNDLSNKYE